MPGEDNKAMNAESLAALLDGREYRREMTKAEEASAKAVGLVVVFGASDDLMEFRGAIYDEVGAYDGGTAYLTPDGLLTNECADDECPHFAKLCAKAATIEAEWEKGDVSWSYETTIPHHTFEVVEDGEVYCVGIVFALADVPKATP